MSNSGVPDEVARRGIVIKPGDVKVGDLVRLEFGHGNYVTDLVSHDGTTWWVDGNDLHGDAYDPEFNDGKRRVVLLKRDGLTVDGRGQFETARSMPDAAPVESPHPVPAPPPGTRPEFEVPWQSVQVGDEVRLEFDDDSAVPHVSGVVQDSGDGLCVYTAAGHGYQIDRPNRRVIMLRRAHEVEMDRVTGVDKLRSEWAAASNVLLGCLMLGPAAPKVPENPGLMLLAMMIQERMGSLLHGIEDNERAAAVLADNGYASNAPFPLAASVGELMKAAKHLEQQRRSGLGTASDFGLARSVAAEAGFEDETLAGAVRAMARRITELEGAVKLHQGAQQTAENAAGEVLGALEGIRMLVSETIVPIPELPKLVEARIKKLESDNRALAADGQAWESKHATALETNSAQAVALAEIRTLLINALADPTIERLGVKHLPSQVGRAIAEARRAGRPLVTGGPNGLSDRIMDLITACVAPEADVDRDGLHEVIMYEIRKAADEARPPVAADKPYSARLADIINRVLPPPPSVSVKERERLHDAILSEIYAHPGERLARPAAGFLADQLVSDVGEVLDTTPDSEQALRAAFVQTLVEFFADGEEDDSAADGAPTPTVEDAFAMLNKTLEDAGKELLRRWESITRRTW